MELRCSEKPTQSHSASQVAKPEINLNVCGCKAEHSQQYQSSPNVASSPPEPWCCNAYSHHCVSVVQAWDATLQTHFPRLCSPPHLCAEVGVRRRCPSLSHPYSVSPTYTPAQTHKRACVYLLSLTLIRKNLPARSTRTMKCKLKQRRVTRN